MRRSERIAILAAYRFVIKHELRARRLDMSSACSGGGTVLHVLPENAGAVVIAFVAIAVLGMGVGKRVVLKKLKYSGK